MTSTRCVYISPPRPILMYIKPQYKFDDNKWWLEISRNDMDQNSLVQWAPSLMTEIRPLEYFPQIFTYNPTTKQHIINKYTKCLLSRQPIWECLSMNTDYFKILEYWKAELS
ncbi:hypothetical protein RF11_03704 [Thelohanellus kitauei]|uniref:Uncharacterized protein n=1 Tax=Thelohanellus kitauei TaxID=669202 RepID=A0A0C2N4M6_THEKT|nr:hypothetical protein RF11_03704 [Thelohanellus kitauei]